jgi:hypothetical protein
MPVQAASETIGLTQHTTIVLVALLALALAALEFCIHAETAHDTPGSPMYLIIWKWLSLSTPASIQIHGRRSVLRLCSLYTYIDRSKGELHAGNTTNTPHPV